MSLNGNSDMSVNDILLALIEASENNPETFVFPLEQEEKELQGLLAGLPPVAKKLPGRAYSFKMPGFPDVEAIAKFRSFLLGYLLGSAKDDPNILETIKTLQDGGEIPPCPERSSDPDMLEILLREAYTAYAKNK